MSWLRTLSTFSASIVFFGFLGFAFLTHEAWTEMQSLDSKLNESYSVLKAANEAHEKSKVSLDFKLEPQFRQNALDEFKKYTSSKKRLTDVLKTELSYQKYIYQLRPELERRIRVYSALAVGFCLALSFLFLIFLQSAFFKPLKELKLKMQAFLDDKYSYEFTTPKNDEIGELHSAFNQLAQKVLDQIEGLKQLDKAKSEFLSIASHELRTPLTSIKGSLSLMEHGVLENISSETQGLLSIAGNETDRLIRLINELLDLAKIEAGQFPLSQEWVNAKALIEDVSQSLTGFSQSANVNIECDVPELIELHIDKDRIKQVITNLASNAIKYSPKDESVILRADINENVFTIEIEDKGKGIAPEDQELIFEKFRQVTGKDNPLVKGTGLGLAIAKALIEEHQGEIGLRSLPGKGSVFYFTLPEWRLVKNSEVAA